MFPYPHHFNLQSYSASYWPGMAGSGDSHSYGPQSTWVEARPALPAGAFPSRALVCFTYSYYHALQAALRTACLVSGELGHRKCPLSPSPARSSSTPPPSWCHPHPVPVKESSRRGPRRCASRPKRAFPWRKNPLFAGGRPAAAPAPLRNAGTSMYLLHSLITLFHVCYALEADFILFSASVLPFCATPRCYVVEREYAFASMFFACHEICSVIVP